MKKQHKNNMRKILAISLLSMVVGGIFHSQEVAKQFAEPSQAPVIAPLETKGEAGDCVKIANGSYDCTDGPTKARMYELAKQGLKWHTKPETPVEKLTAVCEGLKVSDPECPKILKAMATQESFFGKVMVGDGGKSHGWFHIQVGMHGITKACANDLTCSSTWTLKRMIRNGFLTSNKWWAVGSHNSYTPKFNELYVKAVRKHVAIK